MLPHSPTCTQCHAELQPSVRWHPIIPVPLCVGCYVSATQTIHAFYRRHQQQAWLDRQSETRSQCTGRPESAATTSAVTAAGTASVCSEGPTISNERSTSTSTTTSSNSQAPITVCIWCLRLVQDVEAGSSVLRCGQQSSPKHPSHVVFCQTCLGSYFNAPTVEHWSMQSKEGVWTCLICDKTPLLELAWEEGWGLPHYPHDLRLSAEIQDVLAKAFAVPHPRQREITMMSVAHSADENGSETTSEASRKRLRLAKSPTTNSPNLPPFLVPLPAQQQEQPQQQQQYHHAQSQPHRPPQRQPQEEENKEHRQKGSPFAWQSFLAECEGDATLIVLVEQTQQALSLITRLWREAAVQVAAREDILDMGPGLTRNMMLMQQGRVAEGEGLTRRPTIDYMPSGTDRPETGETDKRSNSSSRSGGSSSCLDGSGAGGHELEVQPATARMNMAEKDAQQAIRKSLVELRVLLQQMRLMSDQRQQGSAVEAVRRFQQEHEQQQQLREGAEASSSTSSSDLFGLDYEMKRMEQLQAWLLSSQGVLRCLHNQVLEVLNRAQLQPSRSSSPQTSAETGPTGSEIFPAGNEKKAISTEMEEHVSGKKKRNKHVRQEGDYVNDVEEHSDFERRLRASGESLKELEKDLSLRLEDVGYAVSILCQMKGKAEAREMGQQEETQRQTHGKVVEGQEQEQEKGSKS